MGQRDILLLIARLFHKHKITYLLTGSFAVSYYGYPRATHDIDFVIEISSKSLEGLRKTLNDFGKDYLVDKVSVAKAIRALTSFDVYHTKTGIKIDFWLKKESKFEESKFQRRKIIEIFKQEISIITAEDLILTKLLWCKDIKSERHMRDCIGIWKVQQGKLNTKYLDSWTKRLQVESLLEEMKKGEY